MFKKFSFEIIIINFSISLFLIFYIFFFNKDEKVIVFVDDVKLFNEFKMTKELFNDGEKRFKVMSVQLDSLYASLEEEKDLRKKDLILKEIVNKKQQMESFQLNYSKTNSKIIWKRISDYSAIFSKEKKYAIILGSQYEGDVIYGEVSCDVTKELLVFLNKKYEGLY